MRRHAWSWVALGAALLFVIGPFAWLLVTSLRPEHELTELGLPSRLTLDSYRSVLLDSSFAIALLNSFMVAASTTLLSLALGAPAAFALAKLRFRGQRALLFGALAVSMFPPIATVSPLYLLIKRLGMLDQLLSLVLTYTTFTLPMTLWILSRFFRDIPVQLYEAATVDGCSPTQAFRKVLLPLAWPGLATTAVLVFIFAYSEFLYALTFVSSAERRTVPVAISLFATEHEHPWREIAAASAIAVAPLMALCLAFQRRIVAGLTAGALRE
jgi:multiple sugar transport system permease protein